MKSTGSEQTLNRFFVEVFGDLRRCNQEFIQAEKIGQAYFRKTPNPIDSTYVQKLVDGKYSELGEPKALTFDEQEIPAQRYIARVVIPYDTVSQMTYGQESEARLNFTKLMVPIFNSAVSELKKAAGIAEGSKVYGIGIHIPEYSQPFRVVDKKFVFGLHIEVGTNSQVTNV